MSESGRAQVRAWRPYAVLCAGAIAVAGMALYLGRPRRNGIGSVATAEPVGGREVLPEATLDILEGMDDPFLVLDGAGRIVFANRASKALIGADAAGKRISAVLRT